MMAMVGQYRRFLSGRGFEPDPETKKAMNPLSSASSEALSCRELCAMRALIRPAKSLTMLPEGAGETG